MENILELGFLYSLTQEKQRRVVVVEEIIEIKTAVHIKHSYHDRLSRTVIIINLFSVDSTLISISLFLEQCPRTSYNIPLLQVCNSGHRQT